MIVNIVITEGFFCWKPTFNYINQWIESMISFVLRAYYLLKEGWTEEGPFVDNFTPVIVHMDTQLRTTYIYRIGPQEKCL